MAKPSKQARALKTEYLFKDYPFTRDDCRIKKGAPALK